MFGALWDGISFVHAERPRGMSGMRLGDSDDSVTSHFSAYSQRSLPQWPAHAARVSFMFIACLVFFFPQQRRNDPALLFLRAFLSQGNAASDVFTDLFIEITAVESRPVECDTFVVS